MDTFRGLPRSKRLTPNKLSQEKSLYLRQHQNNPVDWYPWGPEALNKARQEGKPIFLSIGYSACHWCHVMEKESFENPEIAFLLNQEFVSIKVDREERPDLDQIYQNVAQAMTRSGGWPLSVFLTPELKPFYGGTYFPPTDRFGRPGFARVIQALAQAHRQDRASVEENATRLLDFMREIEAIGESSSVELGRKPWDEAAATVLGRMDLHNGGLAGAPKFPNPMILTFLLRYASATGESLPRMAVERSLDAMATGGIFDQIGGGFHRYSVDERWSVPHFEKMLYDNGLLLKLYAEASLAFGARPLWEETMRKTVEYLQREMRGADGIYYSAQDADSEGREGVYFVWDLAALQEVLGEGDGRAAAELLGVTPGGNFEEGKTVVFLAQGKFLPEEWRIKLLNSRSKRRAPATDTKGIVAWNAYLVSGLAWAGRALSNPKITQMAQDLYLALWRGAWNPEGRRLAHLVQDGEARGSAFLDDVAQMAHAGLDLMRWGGVDLVLDGIVIGETVHELTRLLMEQFHDSEGGGFWMTPHDAEALIHRPKTFFDQAVPAGASVALSVLLHREEGAEILGRELSRWSSLAKRQVLGMGELLCTAFMAEQGIVTVSGVSPDRLAHPHVFLERPEGPVQWCWRETCRSGEDWSEALLLARDT